MQVAMTDHTFTKQICNELAFHESKLCVPALKYAHSKSYMFTLKISNNEYFRIASLDADTLIGQSLRINIDIDIHSPEIPFHAWVAFQINDINGKNILYKYIPLDWLRTEWKKDNNHFKHSFLTGELPLRSHLIKVYIWNINKGVYTVENTRVNLYLVE